MGCLLPEPGRRRRPLVRAGMPFARGSPRAGRRRLPGGRFCVSISELYATPGREGWVWASQRRMCPHRLAA